MAETINNPQVVLFANSMVRPMADEYVTFYRMAKLLTQTWTARGLAALTPNTTDTVVDGSLTDGRGRVTGANLVSLIANLNTFITDFEANSNAKLNVATNIAVNPRG